jgi:uncharacterized protein YraI
MRYRIAVIAVLLMPTLVVPIHASIQAQGPDGYATYLLNMRSGPGITFSVVTVLDPETGLYFEGRTADLAWLMVRTEDGTRGWVASLYIVFRDGYGSPANLPISDEVVAAQLAAPADASGQSAAPSDPVVITGLAIDAATVALLESTPVFSPIGPRVHEIFQRGQQLGNHSTVFTQVGECNSQSQAFMVPFGSGAYDLGPYSNLQSTIDFFQTPVGGVSNSFWYKGVAMTTGLTSAAAVDPDFGNASLCAPGQSLLACEYERSRPAVALIHLGLYDVYWLTPSIFETSMRQIIETSIAYGVIPVFTTFPTHPNETASWPNSAEQRYQNRAAFNRSIISLGQEYGIPVMNLWKATNSLDWHGFKPGDLQHVLEPYNANFYTSFNGEQNQFGFTMWNLVALQTLDALRVNVLGG